MAKIYLETYGCTLNQADSDIMHALLKEKNYEIVDSEEKSDAVVINTCTVKGVTENKIISRFRVMAAQNKKFVIAGCMTANQQRLRKFAPLAPILGTSSLSKISEALDSAVKGKPTVFNTHENKDLLPKMLTAPIMRIPINDGCTSSCHFCQTKLARSFLRSYTPKTVIRWINESVWNGAREIQLTSMDSGAYGIDIHTNLVDLLEKIANNDSDDRVSVPFLVRLGMINPKHARRLLGRLANVLEYACYYKFLHVPVQVGSESVCRSMNRDHTVQDYKKIVSFLRSRFPEISIATDIIVGYPTETEEDFEQTKDLLFETTPEVINISRFSPRPGTKAKELKQLDQLEIKRRSGILHDIARKIGHQRKRQFVGRTYKVLITEKITEKTGNYTNLAFKGRIFNYMQVVVRNFNDNLGEFVNVKVFDANHTSLFGEIV